MKKTVNVKGFSDRKVAKHFFANWVSNYGPSTDVIADNGKEFITKFALDFS